MAARPPAANDITHRIARKTELRPGQSPSMPPARHHASSVAKRNMARAARWHLAEPSVHLRSGGKWSGWTHGHHRPLEKLRKEVWHSNGSASPQAAHCCRPTAAASFLQLVVPVEVVSTLQQPEWSSHSPARHDPAALRAHGPQRAERAWRRPSGESASCSGFSRESASCSGSSSQKLASALTPRYS